MTFQGVIEDCQVGIEVDDRRPRLDSNDESIGGKEQFGAFILDLFACVTKRARMSCLNAVVVVAVLASCNLERLVVGEGESIDDVADFREKLSEW